jgi:lycopene beta-cyclase
MTYDYIFGGFGLSTMLLLEELASQNILDGKEILVIEQDAAVNDKSWCFWEQGDGKWDGMLSGRWDNGIFKNESIHKEILNGFTYKCLSSVALSNHIKQLLTKYSCAFKNEVVYNFIDSGNEVTIFTDKQTYHARFFFNSVFNPTKEKIDSRLLLQHFEGFYIESPAAVFNVNEATIMDFSVPQRGNTRFMYVLPFTDTTALVEYTLFSPSLLPKDDYDDAIRKYLDGKKITNYTITKTESGAIPMTSHAFWKKNTKNVLHIGTAGGWTKASTGYTFDRAVKMSQKTANLLKQPGIDFRKFHKPTRFEWYDKLLIEVLSTDNALGKKLFTSLFTKTKSNEVMRFLKEETSIREEFDIIRAVPQRPFLKALLRLITRK